MAKKKPPEKSSKKPDSRRVLDWRTENVRKRVNGRREKYVENLVLKRARNQLREQDAAQLLDDEAIELSPELRERVDYELQQRHGPTLSPEEKSIAVEMKVNGVPVKKIATMIGREYSQVRHFLDRYASTTKLSRMYFESKADVLARRVVRQANVNESLEVLDRLDVLPKKSRGASDGGPTWNVVIGMPGDAGGPPVPTQKAIEAGSEK